jgi:hypothetical protein
LRYARHAIYADWVMKNSSADRLALTTVCGAIVVASAVAWLITALLT